MPDKLAAALPGPVVRVARNRLDYLVEVDSDEEVRAIRPDLGLLASLGNRGVIVTAEAEMTEGADFVSRYFAPGFGIDEDPVTGSTHCALGPYWAERFGKHELVGFQASERGGWVHVRVGSDRVAIGGNAVVVAQGTLSV
jgi:PhzF family phenazine biosynthesis protein